MGNSFRDKMQASIAAAIVHYLDDHPRILATEVEDILPSDYPAEERKQVLLSLQKQGLIRAVGDRRDAYYERTYRRRSVMNVNAEFLEKLGKFYSKAGVRKVLHAMDPQVFHEEE